MQTQGFHSFLKLHQDRIGLYTIILLVWQQDNLNWTWAEFHCSSKQRVGEMNDKTISITIRSPGRWGSVIRCHAPGVSSTENISVKIDAIEYLTVQTWHSRLSLHHQKIPVPRKDRCLLLFQNYPESSSLTGVADWQYSASSSLRTCPLHYLQHLLFTLLLWYISTVALPCLLLIRNG